MQNFFNNLSKWLQIDRFRSKKPIVAVLNLNGPIGSSSSLGRSNLALASISRDIDAAFKIHGIKAVALSINSPGGSPVQSNLIFSRIRSLSEEKNIPVITFTEDVAASGGYWLACAGDEIYADANSIIGSIGVISAGFGFNQLIEKIGIDRRLYASGAHKGMLDSFSPENLEEVGRLKDIQKAIHESFKTLVRERREGKLKRPEEELFTGEFWTGSQAIDLGLIDGIGDLRTVMRKKFGDKVVFKLIGRRPRRFGLPFLGSSSSTTTLETLGQWPENLIAALEARSMWSRFGL